MRVNETSPKIYGNTSTKASKEAFKKPLATVDVLKADIGKLIDLLPNHGANTKEAILFANELNEFLINLIIATTENNSFSQTLNEKWTKLTRNYNNLKFEKDKSAIINHLWINISTKLSHLTIKQHFNDKPLINADTVLQILNTQNKLNVLNYDS